MTVVRCKILAVEDELATRELLKEYFSEESTSFLSAATLGEAYKLLETHRPDIILLDRTMPDGDGVELCVKVRNDPRLHSIPILMLTGKIEVNDKVLGLKTGADDYLTKPFSMLELKARVEVLLRRAGENDLAKQIRNGILKHRS